MPVTAMVLAAGLGRRMLPITAETPKPLVEVGGKALIDHALDRLADAGVWTAVVNVHHLGGQIVAHLAKRRKPRIRISDEREKLLETGGGVVKALPMLGREPFFLLNSDSFWIERTTSNLARLAANWDGEVMDALLMLAPVEATIGYDGPGDFMMDHRSRLRARGPGETAPFVYTGVAIVDPKAMFADAPRGPFALDLLIDRVSRAGRLFGLRMSGTFFHVGTMAAVAEAERLLRNSSAA
ncbi:MAG: nucleotidyltransferase family protein [Bauldia sp.]|jgi:MurNAc alpha-1-phosphate uridylyltransferase